MRKHYLLLLLAALLVPLGAKAQITEFPYVLDFENGLGGWTVIDNDGDDYNWTLSTNYYHSGSSSLLSESYINYVGELTPDNWLVSPAITLGATAMELTWYHYTQDPEYPAEHYAVYISTTGNTVADFDTTAPLFETTLTAADNNWTLNSVSLANYVDQTVYIAFRHYNCTDQYQLYIDDINISVAGAPMVSLTGDNVAKIGINASYTAHVSGGDGTAVSYNWSSLMATAGQATITNPTDSTITILYSATGNDTVTVVVTNSTTSASATFAVTVIECNTITELPFTENFEDNTNIQCWSNIAYDSAETSWRSLYFTSYPDNRFYGAAGATGGADKWLITPAIELPSDASLSLDFDYYGYQYSPILEVRISTTGDDDTSNFSTLLTQLSNISSSAIFETNTIQLDSFAGQTVHIAFVGKCANASGYVFIDNVNLRNSAAPVVTLPATATTDANMATTFAAVITEGILDNMTYTWTSTMEAAGDATMTATDSVLSITYTAGGDDTITVTATNDHGSSTATMHVHVRLCNPIDSFPWIENFATNASLECWTLLDEDGNGATWSRNTSNGGYLHAPYNTSGPDDWAITPAITIPEDADGLVFTWSVSGDSWSVENFYQVLVSPTAGITTADFTDTLFSESYSEDEWVTRTANVIEYAGQTVRFAFRHINTGDDNGMDIDSVCVRMSLAPHISLNGPAAVQLGDTVNFTAILNEGATNNLTYTFSSLAVTAGTADASTNNNIYTISYTAEGTDTVKVVATNDHGSDSAMLAVQIIDYNPATLPYTCGFEPADEDSSWFIQNDVNAWYIDTVAHNSGSYGLYISSDSGATNVYTGTNSISYAKRAITFSQAGQHAFSFDWKANGESTYDFLRAFLVPMGTVLPTSYSNIAASTLPSGYIAIDGGSKLNLKTTWQTATNIATIDVPGTYLLVFCWRNDNITTNNPPAAIDNIAINVVSCPQPLAIEADSTGSDYLAFHWTPAGSEEAWEVIVDSIATEVTDTVFLAENLDGNTIYTVKVRAICGEEDTSVFTSTTMRTECADITLPYFESFENGGDDCWSFATTGSASTTYHSIYNNIAADGTKSLRLFMNNTGNKDYAILPKLENVNTLMITFKNLDYYGDENTLEVGTMANPDNLASFVSLYSTIGNDDDWDEHEVRFDADTTGNQYIAFRVTAAEGYTFILLDDINVLVAPSCLHPEGVSVSNIEATSATITVTDSTNVNNYQVIVYNGTDTVYNELITIDSCQVTGLAAGTEYSVKAYAICDDGNATMAVNTSFKTLCANGNCEFSVAMADSYGDGWNGSAAILVMQNGELQETVKLSTGSSGTANVSTCLGDPVVVTWSKGSWDSEISFSIADASSETILSIVNAGNLLDGDTLVVFDGQCGVSYVYTADTTGPVPPQPGCNTPTITSANATENSITVVWSGNAQSYEVGIAEGAWDSTVTITAAAGPSYTFTGLEANTQYVVGVRAVCSDDSTSQWATRTVSTTNVGIADVAAFAFGLHPNPATSSVTVDLGSASAIVTVIDQSGREVYSRENASGRLTIDVSQMAKGAYFVRVTSAESTAVRKLIVR